LDPYRALPQSFLNAVSSAGLTDVRSIRTIRRRAFPFSLGIEWHLRRFVLSVQRGPPPRPLPAAPNPRHWIARASLHFSLRALRTALEFILAASSSRCSIYPTPFKSVQVFLRRQVLPRNDRTTCIQPSFLNPSRPHSAHTNPSSLISSPVVAPEGEKKKWAPPPPTFPTGGCRKSQRDEPSPQQFLARRLTPEEEI